MKSRIWTVLLICVALVVGLRMFSTSKGKLPEAFASAQGLAAAIDQSSQSGMPVLAFATADWCGPCQKFKKSALSDTGVITWIKDNTHPTLLDCTGANPDAARLGISGLPTLMLLRDGREIARLEGGVGAQDLINWLATHSGPVADKKARRGTN